MYDLKIINARIVDGTGLASFHGEIGIINNLIVDNPVLAIKLLKRQIWQLGRYQQSATGLARYAAKNEIELLKFLIQDNFSKLPVNSKIHSVPHLLENRYSHELAFDIIYNLMVTGNEIEKSIANLMSDALKSFEKQQIQRRRLCPALSKNWRLLGRPQIVRPVSR